MASALKILLVAGARPNFIKVAPVHRALQQIPETTVTLVHTGQHYDEGMSGSFFRVLDIPAPDANLEVGSGSHAVQTARIMERFEPVLLSSAPNAVVVFGDVNSTAACALVAAKLCVPVVHVEAGLRSGDRTMPEEVNRIVTDALSDLLLASEASGVAHLRAEGQAEERIRLVGNVMIDSLRWVLPRIAGERPWERHGLHRGGYGVLTLHRPSNVDDLAVLERLMACLSQVSREVPLVFPAHPRTRAALDRVGWTPPSEIRVCEPVSYTESISLQAGAAVVITDSGRLQEEATCLGVPCLTLRDRTERPATVELGTSTLVGSDPHRILAAFGEVRAGTYKKAHDIPLWDGRASGRVAAQLVSWLRGSGRASSWRGDGK